MNFLKILLCSLMCLNLTNLCVGAETQNIILLKGVFDPQGSLDLQTKKFVEIDAGYSSSVFKRYGWIIEDNISEFQFLTWRGDVTTIRYPNKNEKQPADSDINNFLNDQHNNTENDYPIAWNIKEADYSKQINQFIINGLPREEQNKDDEFGMYRDIRNRFNLADYTVEAAQHAYFSLQLGYQLQASQLYELALRGYNKYDKRYTIDHHNPPQELHSFVANRIAIRWLNGLYHSAHYGESRQDLMKKWEPLSHIEFHEYQEEAKSKVSQYQDLIEEDKLWIEPAPQELEEYSIEQKTKYWLYHLRDHNAAQLSDPGTCSVLYIAPILSLDEHSSEKENAALQLVNLGIEAIPFIIEHLDDPRPTRSKGHWRSYWPESHYLLAYGDCCQQIFELITDFQLYNGKYPIQENAGMQVKMRAEQWWEEHQNDISKQ